MNSKNLSNQKKRSVSRTIIISVLLVVAILVAGILVITSILLTGTFDDNFNAELDQASSYLKHTVSAFMEGAYDISFELSVNPSILTMDTDIQAPILVDSARRNDYFELLYIQGVDGMQTARSSGTLGDRSGRWWFQQMMQLKQPFVSPSYYSVSTNMPVTSVFIPMYENGDMIGIYAADIKLGYIQDLISQFADVGNGRYSFIIDGDGAVLAHPDNTYLETLTNYKKLTRTVSQKDASGNTMLNADGTVVTKDEKLDVSSSFKAVIDAVMGGKGGVDIITDGGKTYFAGYQPINLPGTSASWSVITLQDRNIAMSVVNQLIISVLIIAFVIAIVAVLVFVFIINRITRPIKSLSEKLSVLAEGDLNVQLSTESRNDEIGQCVEATVGFLEYVRHFSRTLEGVASGDLTTEVELLSARDEMGIALANMVDRLNNSFIEIGASADHVSRGSNQVAGGAQTLAQGSIEQASSIEVLSNLVAEISQQIRDNAVKADQTAKLSVSIRASAEKGSHQMDDMIAAVNDINDASKSIGKIIKTIDDIAFQTNILALNAAVEAARAGQHGKGFAVVAEEVRNLASKSADAAKDTGNMIQNSMKKAELGARIAGETAASLKDIVTGINETAELVDEIARASEGQALGIEQINSGIDQVARVVTQNTATAEESSTASEEMRGQSVTLQELVSKFRTKA